jgi:hypothetical protein
LPCVWRVTSPAAAEHFAIDRAKAEEDAKFDGIFVLRTNTELPPTVRSADA